MEIRVGKVDENTSIAQNGTFTVNFDLAKKGEPAQGKPEIVQYVSPFGSKHSGFIGIPTPGSTVLCVRSAGKKDDTSTARGWYYLGSVMGNIPGLNDRVPTDEEGNIVPGPPTPGSLDPIFDFDPTKDYVPKTDPGIAGPPIAAGQVPFVKEDWAMPTAFRGMYNAKGIVPEQYGMVDLYNGNLLLSSRSRANQAEGAYQDYRIQIQSGKGKTVKCVDSPIVEGIIMDPATQGKEYFIFSTGNSPQSPFSKGEWHMRTHGPVNMYTMANNMHFWVQEGRNLQLENLAYGNLVANDGAGNTSQTKVTNTQPGARARIVDLGHEGYGCIEIRSQHNNVIIEGEGDDSVIRVNAPGTNTKVIINTGGTVDIVAEQKITLQSNTKIELNAPEIDINAGSATGLGAGNVYIDGDEVRLNDRHTPPTL